MISFSTYFSILFICVGWCCGFFAITRPEKLFEFLPKLTNKLPKKIKDPLTHCIGCMASVHSLLVYGLICLFGIFGFTDFHFQVWILIAIPCAFLNELLWEAKMMFEKYNKRPY